MPLFHSYLHGGKWSQEEELYAAALIETFKAGELPREDIETGLSLRKYLSKKLLCSPKRISKKFEGTQYNGKQIYEKKQCSEEQQLARRANLQVLEHRFLQILSDRSKTGKEQAQPVAEAVPQQPSLRTVFSGAAQTRDTLGGSMLQGSTLGAPFSGGHGTISDLAFNNSSYLRASQLSLYGTGNSASLPERTLGMDTTTGAGYPTGTQNMGYPTGTQNMLAETLSPLNQQYMSLLRENSAMERLVAQRVHQLSQTSAAGSGENCLGQAPRDTGQVNGATGSSFRDSAADRATIFGSSTLNELSTDRRYANLEASLLGAANQGRYPSSGAASLSDLYVNRRLATISQLDLIRAQSLHGVGMHLLEDQQHRRAIAQIHSTQQILSTQNGASGQTEAGSASDSKRAHGGDTATGNGCNKRGKHI